LAVFHLFKVRIQKGKAIEIFPLGIANKNNRNYLNKFDKFSLFSFFGLLRKTKKGEITYKLRMIKKRMKLSHY